MGAGLTQFRNDFTSRISAQILILDNETNLKLNSNAPVLRVCNVLSI